MDLRKKGLTYKQIGSELKCSEQRAWKIVSTELKKIHLKISEDAEEVKTLELQRLDTLYEAVIQKAISIPEDGEDVKEVNLYAIDRCLRIMERRAKLLGLDSPDKVEVDETISQSEKVMIYIPDNTRDKTDNENN
ncbi:MAG: hypothetical protein PHN17_09910 [Syntrophaceticus sp.]|nr:hypothetical protein [Syntrophaceticus sp.]